MQTLRQTALADDDQIWTVSLTWADAQATNLFGKPHSWVRTVARSTLAEHYVIFINFVPDDPANPDDILVEGVNGTGYLLVTAQVPAKPLMPTSRPMTGLEVRQYFRIDSKSHYVHTELLGINAKSAEYAAFIERQFEIISNPIVALQHIRPR